MQISIAPNRAEHARITAYIIASHLRGTQYRFGDYWNYTEAEKDAIFETWRRLEIIDTQYRFTGQSFWDHCPSGHKAKLIMAIHRQALKEAQNETN